MKALASVLTVVAVALLVPSVHAADAKDLVGTWIIEKGEGAPKGAEIEFTKDGKLKLTIEIQGKKESISGTYKVDGEKLEVTLTAPNGKEEKDVATIKTLTKDKLVIVDKDKKETELKKK